MSFHNYLVLLFFFFPIYSYSQPSNSDCKSAFQYEFSIINDNDVYTLQPRDGYYTNGFYMKLNYAADKFKKQVAGKGQIKKVINGIMLGQAIYNPMRPWYILPEQQDMPFSSYLSITFDKHIYYSNNNILELGMSLGTIGPNGLGEEVQRGYHKLIGMYDVGGWDTQLKNEFNINIKASFVKSIIKGNKENRIFNIDGFANGELGNAHTNIALGALFRAGKMENNWNSSHWQARVTSVNDVAPTLPYEIYLFYHPSITFNAYDATLQGGFFIKDKGPVTKDIKTVVITNQFGIRYAKNRWTTAFIYVRRSKKGKTQIRAENFCSVQFAYRFRKMKVK